MSELEICRLAYEGKFMEFKAKIEANVFEDLSRKKDRVRLSLPCCEARIFLLDIFIVSSNCSSLGTCLLFNNI